MELWIWTHRISHVLNTNPRPLKQLMIEVVLCAVASDIDISPNFAT